MCPTSATLPLLNLNFVSKQNFFSIFLACNNKKFTFLREKFKNKISPTFRVKRKEKETWEITLRLNKNSPRLSSSIQKYSTIFSISWRDAFTKSTSLSVHFVVRFKFNETSKVVQIIGGAKGKRKLIKKRENEKTNGPRACFFHSNYSFHACSSVFIFENYGGERQREGEKKSI